jgi:hypothetical protein
MAQWKTQPKNHVPDMMPICGPAMNADDLRLPYLEVGFQAGILETG